MMNEDRVGLGRAWMLFIEGRFVESQSGATVSLGSDSVAQAVPDDIHLAVVAAQRGFARWAQTPADARGTLLYRFAELLESRRGELAELGGEADSPQGALARAVWYAGVCDKIEVLLGSSVPSSGSFVLTTAIEPRGVVGIVVPPEPGADGFLAAVLPPLAAGNAVVAIAPGDPRAALVIAECSATAALPAGVLNVLSGEASVLAPALAGHGALDVLVVYRDDPALVRACVPERAAHGATVERRGVSDDPLDALLRVTKAKTLRQTAAI